MTCPNHEVPQLVSEAWDYLEFRHVQSIHCQHHNLRYIRKSFGVPQTATVDAPLSHLHGGHLWAQGQCLADKDALDTGAISGFFPLYPSRPQRKDASTALSQHDGKC